MPAHTYLLVDLTHGEILVIARACHTDVLEPAASPRLTGIHAELLAAQVFGDLLRKKENQAGQRHPPREEPASRAQSGRPLSIGTRVRP